MMQNFTTQVNSELLEDQVFLFFYEYWQKTNHKNLPSYRAVNIFRKKVFCEIVNFIKNPQSHQMSHTKYFLKRAQVCEEKDKQRGWCSLS